MKKLEKFREPLNVFPSNLSAAEQDIFALVLVEISKVIGFNRKVAQGQAEGDIRGIPTSFEFTEDELTKVFDCHRDKIMKTLRPAADALITKQIRFAQTGKRYSVFSLVSGIEYEKGGNMTIFMHEKIINFLGASIMEGFSEIDFMLFVRLSGKYERRILKKLSQWKNNNDYEVKLSIDEYRELIGIPDGKYRLFSQLKERCMIGPIKDIINKSNGVWVPTDNNKLGFELVKVGRSYSHIVLKMNYVDPNEVVNEPERPKEVKEMENALLMMNIEMRAVMIPAYQILLTQHNMEPLAKVMEGIKQ